MKVLKLTTINEELIRQNHIVDSFLPLLDTNNDSLLNEFAEITNKLITEGYTPLEIDSIFEQNFVNNAVQGVKDAAQRGGYTDMGKDMLKSPNIGKSILGGITSSLKESIIRAILGYLGIKGTFATDAIVFFNDYDIRDILKPFKSSNDCTTYGPKMIDGIIEVMLRHIIDKDSDVQTNPISRDSIKIGVRNIIGDSIRQSNLGEIISDKFCKGVVWKQ